MSTVNGSDRLHPSQDTGPDAGGNGFLDKEHEREILERERNSRSARPEIIHPLDLQPGAGGPGLVVGAANMDPSQGWCHSSGAIHRLYLGANKK